MTDCTRREFLGTSLGAVAALPGVLDAFASTSGLARSAEVRHYRKLGDGRTQCFVCPLRCVLRPGETCFCRTRENVDGRLISRAYNNPCLLSIDPIEKMPLHHFRPGTKTLSLAVGGCNLRCLYCQNWQQSQTRPRRLRTFELPKEKAVSGASRRALDTIAYTYTEPVAFLEYMEDLSAFGRERGMKNVCATALFIEPIPLKKACKTIDAFSVSLKGFDEKFYAEALGSRLKPVLDALVVVKSEGVWLEIVNLVVPTYNDDLGKIKEMCLWIRKNLGTQVPLHFGRFVPEYRLRDLPRTPAETLERARGIGLECGLEHVYIFNLAPHEGNNTFCASCRKAVVKRLGFRILENRLSRGRCGHCGAAIPGVWE